MSNEVEAETIGDWAGHTPKPEATQTSFAEGGDQLNLKLLQRERGTITQQVFGLEPYIILRPTVTEDEGEFVVNIEAGGGADLSNTGLFLETIAEALLDSAVVDQITAAVETAIAEQDGGE